MCRLGEAVAIPSICINKLDFTLQSIGMGDRVHDVPDLLP